MHISDLFSLSLTHKNTHFTHTFPFLSVREPFKVFFCIKWNRSECETTVIPRFLVWYCFCFTFIDFSKLNAISFFCQAWNSAATLENWKHLVSFFQHVFTEDGGGCNFRVIVQILFCFDHVNEVQSFAKYNKVPYTVKMLNYFDRMSYWFEHDLLVIGNWFQVLDN